MIATGLCVICEHDCNRSMSDMWTWLIRVYEWYVNMIYTGLWVICEHDWYGSMSDMWTWLIRVYEWYVNMIDTGLWVICEHDWYGSMSDMWTWLMRVYEWHVNMSDIILWATGEYGWYGSMVNKWLWLMRFCESHVSMIYTGVCELDCKVLRSGGGIMVKIYGNVWITSSGDYIGGVWVCVIVFQQYGVYRRCQQYFSYIAAVSFISGGNRRARSKPPTCRKLLTHFITWCCIECTTPEVDCIGSNKSHTITNTTVPLCS